MTPRPWQKLGDDTLARHLVFHVRRSRQRSPRTGAEIPLFLIDTADWVNILPITVDDELVFVRQWRHGSERVSLELPGGLIDPHETDPMQAAVRELREETGHAAEHIECIGSMNPNPALMSNRCYAFVATGCRPVGELQQDLGEDIEVVTVPLRELDAMLSRGEVDHAIVLATIALWRARCAELRSD